MVRYTFVDILIVAFLGYHMARGYTKGIKYVFFEAFRLFCVWLLAGFIDRSFYNKIAETVWFEILFSVFFSFVRPLTRVFGVATFFPWRVIFFYLALMMLFSLGFKYVFSAVGGDQKTRKEKLLGFLGGGAKATIYMFVLVAMIDPMIQAYGSKLHPAITRSFFLPLLYKYNIILHFFQ